MAENNNLTPGFVMSGVAAQRASGILCDVELQAEGKVIPAHRTILAAASPFFYGMFTSDFKEKTEKVVTLEDVTFDALKVVIDSIYKFKIKLTNRIVPEVFAAAHLMEISGLIEQCKKHMIEKMSKATCFSFLAIAEKYELKDVVDKVNEFVLANFVDISKTPEFKKISKDALCHYICCDTLNFKKNEALVFEAAQRWLEANSERLQFVGEVMKKVRFMLISADKLGEIGDKNIVGNSAECQKLIRDALVYQANVLQQPLIQTYQNQPRGKQDIITISCSQGKDQWKSTANETDVYHGSNGSPTRLQQVFLRQSLSAVQLNNFIFIFGTDNDTLCPVTLRYNVSTNSWMDLKPVPRQGTIGSKCAMVNGSIYVIGGMFMNKKTAITLKFNGSDITNSAHSYCVSSNGWTKITDLPRPVVHHAQCTMGTVIHVSGGRGVASISEKHFLYDTAAALWLTKSSMISPRSEHVMEAVGTSLYVFGGVDEEDGIIGTIECYDSLSDQWTEINNTKYQSILSSLFVSGDDIFITGGLVKENGSNKRSGKIMKFNVKSHEIVEQSSPLKFAEYGHVSALMTLPELL